MQIYEVMHFIMHMRGLHMQKFPFNTKNSICLHIHTHYHDQEQV